MQTQEDPEAHSNKFIKTRFSEVIWFATCTYAEKS